MQPSKIDVLVLGVREGFLYSLLNEEERRADPLISATETPALLHACSVCHAHELTEWTKLSFAAFGIEETKEETRYRHAACLLTEISWCTYSETVVAIRPTSSPKPSASVSTIPAAPF